MSNADVDPVDLHEAAHHEPGAGEQHQRERELRDDERGVQRRARMPPEPDRPPSFRTSLTFVFETCSAGARPKRMPVRTQTRREEREDA